MITIQKRFAELRERGEKALAAFIVAGDPTAEKCVEIAVAMAGAGVDILELGIPFSDPSADEPVIQRASKRALADNIDIDAVFSIVTEIRKQTDIPIVLFTYYNPVFVFGEEKFCKEALLAGVNGILVVDLPFEEKSFLKEFEPDFFPKIELISATTTGERRKKIAESAGGFLYLLSKPGIPGSSVLDVESMSQGYEMVRQWSDVPVCTGVGITTSDEVAVLSQIFDGVVINSAFVTAIEESSNDENLVEKIGALTADFKRAAKQGRFKDNN